MAGFYIHLPFCRKKCYYCGFVSGFKPNSLLIEKYVDYLTKEYEIIAERYILPDINTLYFGGGTPSLIPPNLLEKLIRKLKLNISGKEITIEANPEDINYSNVKEWKDIGINRISLGFQSMDDNVLKFLGRENTASVNFRAYEIASKFFDNISIDIMLSVPGDNLSKWINEILQIAPVHISVYSLSIENGSVFKLWEEKKRLKLLSENEYIKNYVFFINNMIKSGYIHYEISNLATDEKYFSKHNCGYWNYEYYIGLGVGASGFLSDKNGKNIRYTNTNSIIKYFDFLDNFELPLKMQETLSEKQKILEFVMVGLRKIKGIKKYEFKEKFGICIDNLLSDEFINKMKKYLISDNDTIRLTFDGILLENQIIVNIWEEMEKNMQHGKTV